MDLNRRQMIKGIGAAIIAGAIPKFVPELVGGYHGDPIIKRIMPFDVYNSDQSIIVSYKHYASLQAVCEQYDLKRLPDVVKPSQWVTNEEMYIVSGEAYKIWI